MRCWRSGASKSCRRVMKLKLQGRTCFNHHLTPGGKPPTSNRHNHHGISEAFGYFPFRIRNDTCIRQIWCKSSPLKMLIMNNIRLVEAAGVEPDISVENTQLTDSGNVSFAGNAMISKSTVQTLYKLFLKFPERQSSDFPSWRKRRILKRSYNSYTSADAGQELNCVCLPAILIRSSGCAKVEVFSPRYRCRECLFASTPAWRSRN